MTSEEGKRLILLTAIISLGGEGSKNKVLEEIARLDLIALSPSDLERMKSRNEIKWKNDLAFIRKHLVTENFISDENWDSWRITKKGKEYHGKLNALTSKSSSFRLLKPEALRTAIDQTEFLEISDSNALAGETGFDGLIKHGWTTRYERDAKLRGAAIALHGTICMGCGFSFKKAYGVIGSGFIEVHHTKPVSSLGGSTQVDPATDLVVLCSNCHSIVHRKRQCPLSMGELHKVISENILLQANANAQQTLQRGAQKAAPG